MYTNLEYDSENDLWCLEGTKSPYTGEHEIFETMDDNKGTLCRMSGFIEDGKMTGLWTVYNSGENVAMEVSYLNGELNGPFKGYHYEGKLHCTFGYKNGNRDGKWKWFKEDGSLEKSQSWVEDELVS